MRLHLLGTALTPGHASLIKRYVKEVYLTYDSDEAGTKAALRAIPILKECRDYGKGYPYGSLQGSG